ncbi:MAG: hypothetical protein ACXACI_00930 [Candidatus Hodarchaeales archaeon]
MDAQISQTLRSASIELLQEDFVLSSISKKKLGMLLELVRVLEEGMFAFILGKDLTLVVTNRTWQKLAFDFDEGRTITGLRLISIHSETKMDSVGLNKALAEVLGERIGSVVLAFEDQYLLIHENDAQDVLEALKGLS